MAGEIPPSSNPVILCDVIIKLDGVKPCTKMHFNTRRLKVARVDSSERVWRHVHNMWEMKAEKWKVRTNENAHARVNVKKITKDIVRRINHVKKTDVKVTVNYAKYKIIYKKNECNYSRWTVISDQSYFCGHFYWSIGYISLQNIKDSYVFLVLFCCLRGVLESGAHASFPQLSLQQEGFAGNVRLARWSRLEPPHHPRKENNLLNRFISEELYSHSDLVFNQLYDTENKIFCVISTDWPAVSGNALKRLLPQWWQLQKGKTVFLSDLHIHSPPTW